MAINPASLSEIKDSIVKNQALILNEGIVGQNLFNFLKQSFHQQEDFRLTNCTMKGEAENPLTFSGVFSQLFPWKEDVRAEITLFDLTLRPTIERHAIFRMTIPDTSTAYAYLSQYSSAKGELVSLSATALPSNLGNFIGDISFSQTAVVFSSVDYSITRTETIFYPEAWQAFLPAHQVKAGLNFFVHVTLDSGLGGYLEEVLGGSHAEAARSQGLIYPGEGGPYFLFRKDMAAGKTFGAFNLEFKDISLILALAPDNETGPEFLLDGAVKIKDQGFNVEVDFNAYYRELSLSFTDFPSLNQLIKLADLNSLEAYFPEPLSSMLDIQLSKLAMVFGLADKSVSVVSFSLTTEHEIELIPQVISFKPTLEMQIYAPFAPDLRSIEGDLKGTWQLGSTKFETALYYPTFSFSAVMTAGQTLDVAAVVEHILPGIRLPEIELTKMDLEGNFLSKSFSAEISVDGKWEFDLAGRPFGVRELSMRVAYDAQQGTSCALAGQLELAGVNVFISAQYDTSQGWMLLGGTAFDDTINIGALLNDLLQAIVLPAHLPDLKLTHIVFTAAPKTGEYSLSGQSAEDWQLMDGLSLKVEQFTANKSAESPVNGMLKISMTICETVVRLKAEKAASAGGGWQFEGSTGQGQNIPIGNLITWLGEKFGATLPPPAIKKFTIENLKISFNTQSKDFAFTCQGNITFPEANIDVEGVITIAIKNQQDGSFAKHFGGVLIINGLEFDLVFESVGKMGGDASSKFLAAYLDPQGRATKIDDLINAMVTSPIETGLEFTLKEALFAYQSQTPASSEAPTPEAEPQATPAAKYLFGLDIEGGLNLSDVKLPSLPLISSQPRPPDQTLKLAFQVLYPSQPFTAEEIAALNALNKNGLNLPAKEIKGLDLAASLRLGQETMQLSLPVGLNKPATTPQLDAPAATAAKPGLVDGKQLPANAATAATAQTTAQAASADGVQWIKLQKSFGPVHFERVGLKYQDGQISGLLDAALTVAGLTIGLDGLTVSSPLDHFAPTFDLRGLSIDYRNGPVEIGGAFLRVEAGFAGLAVIRTEELTLSAIGAYADMAGQPSLFIYAVLDYPLGGPAFFFVTGLAAGFGYNRVLTMPTIDQIASFPLVETVLQDQAPPSLPTDAAGRQATITTELNKLSSYLPPTLGEHFLAVGVRFTSFKMIDSFALLVVKFGHRFEIDLLGLSTLVAPTPVPGKPPVPPVAEVQLALKATFIPSEGFLGVLAQLTPNSYLLSKACHLTGGFAFYVWFAPHPDAGDFVVTLGGYHPQYRVPAHYPQVPRLGFNWQVDPHLNLKGDAYFAMTPQALMAGGHLEATWQMGNLKAWFKAGIDFLITWQPYHYDAAFYIDIGVSYTFDFFGSHTLTAELGADLHIWGPEFAGTARVHWYIISFEVSFGSGGPGQLQPISWDAFKQSFLPLKKEKDKVDPICTISVQKGLVRQIKFDQEELNSQDKEAAEEYWIINPKECVLVTDAIIPSKQAFQGTGENQVEPLATEPARTDLAVTPMGITSDKLTTSSQTITITRPGDKNKKEYVGHHFDYVPILKAMPAGLWGEPKLTEDGRLEPLALSDLNGKQRLIENSLAGFEIRAKTPTPGKMADIDRSEVLYETEPVPEAYWWEDFSVGDLQGQAAWNKAKESVLATPTKIRRDDLLKALGLTEAMIDFGQPVDENVLVI